MSGIPLALTSYAQITLARELRCVNRNIATKAAPKKPLREIKLCCAPELKSSCLHIQKRPLV